MNIEDLSKTQLLLLTILVNFITAIATAVMTVSLLEEAPPTVTQTVNRIVERTVQTVEQAPLPIPGLAPRETTVLVREQDLLASAIRADAARRVTIHRGATSTPPIAVGTFLSDKRVVITASGQNLPKEATIVFADGSIGEASLSRAGATLTVYGFADAASLPTVSAPKIIPSADITQGQTLIALTREGAAITGMVSLVNSEGIRSSFTTAPTGAAVVNTDGNLIGIATGVPGLLAPAERITTILTENL